MTTHHIPVSEELYQRLQAQALRVGRTPEQVIAQLLDESLIAPHDDLAFDEPVPPAGSPEALAAVERLTTLFAYLLIPNVDAVLDDPAIEMANAPFADEPR